VVRPSAALLIPALAGLLISGCTARPARPGGTATTSSPAAAGSPAGPSAARPCGALSPHSAQYRHVVWIWFENRSYGDVADQPSLPYLYRLGRVCGLATDYHAIRHPSLPNYLAAATGRDPGPIGDCEPQSCPQRGPTIFAQLGAARWVSYDEGMPAVCDSVTSGAYAARHNPAVYFSSIYPACRQDDVPFSGFAAAAGSGRLPAFTWITPDVCDDMHDCSSSTGDAWLARWLPVVLDGPQYRSGSTVVFITWDESSGTSGTDQVALYVVGPTVTPGTRVGTLANHFSLLGTTERLLGLPLLGAAARAGSLAGPFGL
jgi:hypothetical protein